MPCVSFADAKIRCLPRPIRPYFERSYELIEAAIVGATTFAPTRCCSTLKLTILKPCSSGPSAAGFPDEFGRAADRALESLTAGGIAEAMERSPPTRCCPPWLRYCSAMPIVRAVEVKPISDAHVPVVAEFLGRGIPPACQPRIGNGR